ETGGPKPLDFALDVIDDELDPVPAPRDGLPAVRHGAPSRAHWPGEQQTQTAPDHIGESRRRTGAEFEPEMRGVELDGGINVVDHIAHVDRVFGHVPLTSRLALFDDVKQQLQWASISSLSAGACSRTNPTAGVSPMEPAGGRPAFVAPTTGRRQETTGMGTKPSRPDM